MDGLCQEAVLIVSVHMEDGCCCGWVVLGSCVDSIWELDVVVNGLCQEAVLIVSVHQGVGCCE